MGKKWISLLLALILALSCSACGGPTEAPEETTVDILEGSMQKSDPAKDDTLNILMIGNSFCYYYPDELYGMAQAAGIKMRICNVYYSGCKISQHWTWWKNGEANYSFHENGIMLAENVNLEYCMRQGNWDVISLQTADSIKDNSDAEARLEFNKLWLDDLFGYIRKQFPLSQMAWHHTWSYQVGTAANGVVTTAESQAASQANNRALALLLCDTYDLIRINTGEAWKIIRDGGYDNLCARLGKNVPGAAPNTGDNYHDGDIGGGQYLNACVWFEVLTGQSCIGNTYVPQYSINSVPYEMLIDLETLQNAAHQAVAQLNNP